MGQLNNVIATIQFEVVAKFHKLLRIKKAFFAIVVPFYFCCWLLFQFSDMTEISARRTPSLFVDKGLVVGTLASISYILTFIDYKLKKPLVVMLESRKLQGVIMATYSKQRLFLP